MSEDAFWTALEAVSTAYSALQAEHSDLRRRLEAVPSPEVVARRERIAKLEAELVELRRER